MAGKRDIDSFITHKLPLADINQALGLMHRGESLRTVIDMA